MEVLRQRTVMGGGVSHTSFVAAVSDLVRGASTINFGLGLTTWSTFTIAHGRWLQHANSISMDTLHPFGKRQWLTVPAADQFSTSIVTRGELNTMSAQEVSRR